MWPISGSTAHQTNFSRGQVVLGIRDAVTWQSRTLIWPEATLILVLEA